MKSKKYLENSFIIGIIFFVWICLIAALDFLILNLLTFISYQYRPLIGIPILVIFNLAMLMLFGVLTAFYFKKKLLFFQRIKIVITGMLLIVATDIFFEVLEFGKIGNGKRMVMVWLLIGLSTIFGITSAFMIYLGEKLYLTIRK